MKSNTLGALNNHLFAELERLSEEDLKGDALAEEINRAKAITGVAKEIISNANVALQAMKFADDKYNADTKLPNLLTAGD